MRPVDFDVSQTANPADYDNGMLTVSQISLLPQKQSAQ